MRHAHSHGREKVRALHQRGVEGILCKSALQSRRETLLDFWAGVSHDLAE